MSRRLPLYDDSKQQVAYDKGEQAARARLRPSQSELVHPDRTDSQTVAFAKGYLNAIISAHVDGHHGRTLPTPTPEPTPSQEPTPSSASVMVDGVKIIDVGDEPITAIEFIALADAARLREPYGQQRPMPPKGICARSRKRCLTNWQAEQRVEQARTHGDPHGAKGTPNAYYCDDCGYWHYGHTKRNQRMR